MKAIQLAHLLFFAVAVGDSRAADAPASLESPHSQAIRLVMQARASEIEKVDDSGGWWQDIKERTWSAKRVFLGGVLDTAHAFTVTYSIDGRVVGTWAVNTRTGQVSGQGQLIPVE